MKTMTKSKSSGALRHALSLAIAASNRAYDEVQEAFETRGALARLAFEAPREGYGWYKTEAAFLAAREAAEQEQERANAALESADADLEAARAALANSLMKTATL